MASSQDAAVFVKSWYSTESDLSLSLEPATLAYKEAFNLFETRFSSDDDRKDWIANKHTMRDVQNVVDKARELYEQNSRPSKARMWLQRLSKRVVFYSVVFDTLTNGAPEYASFGWGTLKFLFMAVINQGELVSKLAKALTYIADSLPHVELRTILYPTEKMKKAVATLYAHIINFIQRAAKWYNESKFRHAVGSILRPYALSFQDIQDEISVLAREVDMLAVSASMAEQRIMHLAQRGTHQLLVDVNSTLQAFQKQTLATTLDTNKRVCEIQFSQIQTFTSDPSFPSPEITRKSCQAMRDQRRRRTPVVGARQVNADLFACLPRLQLWASAFTSSVILVRGAFKTRHQAKDFAINAVDLAITRTIPTVWVLNPTKDARYRDPLIIDLLKQLISQVLRLNHTLLNERSLALSAARFQSAKTEQEWFDILGSVVEGLEQLYVVIDVECLHPLDDSSTTSFQWLEAFRGLFHGLRSRGVKTVVKVVLVNYLRVLKLRDGDESCLVLLPKERSGEKGPKCKNRKRPVGTQKIGLRMR